LKTLCYDIEVFQNLATFTFINVEDQTDEHVFYFGLDKLDYTDLLKFLKQEMSLCGYNNHRYDDVILRYIMSYKGVSLNSDLYKLSGKLVDDNYRNDPSLNRIRYPKFGTTWKSQGIPWTSVDLMKLMAFDKLGISLKQIAINLKWYWIQDLPIPYNAIVGQHQLELVLKYNKNDVEITNALRRCMVSISEIRTKPKRLDS